MDLGTVTELLEKQNGHCSFFYPILKDRLEIYPCEEVPFPTEFLFFEERYLQIKKHIIENNIKQDIVDIGCQFGFQSELFLDSISYLGIDCYKPTHFMNSEKDNVNYVVGLFPKVGIDLTEKTVISSMSLGYFDNYVDKNEEVGMNLIIDALKSADTIYIASKENFVNKLSTHFKSIEILEKCNHGDFSLYVLRKEVNHNAIPNTSTLQNSRTKWHHS
jgi:hypothetical protein